MVQMEAGSSTRIQSSGPLSPEILITVNPREVNLNDNDGKDKADRDKSDFKESDMQLATHSILEKYYNFPFLLQWG